VGKLRGAQGEEVMERAVKTGTEKTGVRLAGFGGQGIVLAGMILGKAVTLYEGENAVMTQSYGPEARGGACSADVVISTKRINYPRVGVPDVLVLMSEEAARTYGSHTVDLVLVNEDLVKTVPRGRTLRILRVPATGIAKRLGRVIVANIVMLGFITAVSGIVSLESMKRAVLDSIPKGTEELNLSALQAGFDYGATAAQGAGAGGIAAEGR
jgi:2-oxoglutarate ferredoxin oxidoreductase subunit gamma